MDSLIAVINEDEDIMILSMPNENIKACKKDDFHWEIMNEQKEASEEEFLEAFEKSNLNDNKIAAEMLLATWGITI